MQHDVRHTCASGNLDISFAMLRKETFMKIWFYDFYLLSLFIIFYNNSNLSLKLWNDSIKNQEFGKGTRD